MKICIGIQSYRFDKRLCWMLSSILQQKPRKEGKGLPEIEIRVSYLDDAITKQNTEKVLDLFTKEGLDIRYAKYTNREIFKYRGNVRNNDLKVTMKNNQLGKTGKFVEVANTTADWIMWADSDMVYPPNFFGEMGHLLRTTFKGNPHCLHSARQSTILEPTQELIHKYTYPCIIPDAYAQASKLEAKMKANIGAGYCQIANVANLMERHNGVYAKKVNDHDWDTQGQKAKSDIQFRHMLGGEKIPLPVQIHLQHLRTKPDERDC